MSSTISVTATTRIAIDGPRTHGGLGMGPAPCWHGTIVRAEVLDQDGWFTINSVEPVELRSGHRWDGEALNAANRRGAYRNVPPTEAQVTEAVATVCERLGGVS
jgi:hypothetical protein